MSYQFSYSFDEKVCGPVTLFDPVDPDWMYKRPRTHKLYSASRDVEAEYDWDDSYRL